VPTTVLLTVRVEVPDPVTEVGFNVAVTTDGALTVRLTVPENPPRDETVIVLVAEDGHALDVIEVGFAVSVKSCTLTVTIVAWESDPLVPVTVTV